MQRGSVIFIGIGVVVIAAVSAFLLFLLFLRPHITPNLPATTAVTPTPLTLSPTAVVTPSPNEIPTAEATTPGRHIVQPGDTLFSIAQTYGITVEALMTANNLTDNIIYPDDVLIIPDN